MLLCLSGGADSTALFRAFLLARIPFEAAHCNFNLRGDESTRDSEFVSSLCRDAGVTLHMTDFDTRSLLEKGESVEMACRRLRYDFFRSLKSQYGFDRIVVAHNADDNIETFFLNALRGSGSRGLRGMRRDDGTLLRPLLKVSRKEILEFLDQLNQDFVTDSSNLSSDYRRNFLRNEILPLLRSRWEGLDKSLDTTIGLLEKENEILEKTISETLAPFKNSLPFSVILKFPDPETLVFRFISQFGGSSDIAEEISRSLPAPIPGKWWRLSENHRAIATRDALIIEPEVPGQSNDFSPSVSSFEWQEFPMNAEVMEKAQSASLNEIYLPLGPDNFEWRHADKDMFIRPLGMKGKQSVWKILKDAGIPAVHRGRFPVLVEKLTGQPVWVPGLKRSGLFLLSGDEKSVFYLCSKTFRL